MQKLYLKPQLWAKKSSEQTTPWAHLHLAKQSETGTLSRWSTLIWLEEPHSELWIVNALRNVPGIEERTVRVIPHLDLNIRKWKLSLTLPRHFPCVGYEWQTIGKMKEWRGLTVCMLLRAWESPKHRVAHLECNWSAWKETALCVAAYTDEAIHPKIQGLPLVGQGWEMGKAITARRWTHQSLSISAP